MKLASLRAGRDGELLIVSRDLSRAVHVGEIAPTLQSALDSWANVAGELGVVYERLNEGGLKGSFAFDPRDCAAPLPRAYQWADGSAYVNHVELVRRARGAAMPASFWHEPLIYQGGSDDMLGPTDDIVVRSAEWGLDFEAEIAVIVDDVAMGTPASDAGEHVKLLMLVNDISLRGLIPQELEKGFGFFQSKPATAFSPVAVSPDELCVAWRENKLHGPLLSRVNGRLFGKPDAGVDMTFDFAELIAHAARTRRLGAGSVVGSGTVSNRQEVEGGSSVAAGGVGYSCIAELRMIETIRDGTARTPFLQEGDRVTIEMLDEDGSSIFGSIDQRVVIVTG
jgi:fumarylacetoacetate (FAA) hydrolase